MTGSRSLQNADPVNLAGGFDPYAYLSNNWLTGIDPLGLYENDTHYYLTFYLGVTAGVDEATARQENGVHEPVT
jgi:hypothetical protein